MALLDGKLGRTLAKVVLASTANSAVGYATEQTRANQQALVGADGSLNSITGNKALQSTVVSGIVGIAAGTGAAYAVDSASDGVNRHVSNLLCGFIAPRVPRSSSEILTYGIATGIAGVVTWLADQSS